jgi:hypothetical protein
VPEFWRVQPVDGKARPGEDYHPLTPPPSTRLHRCSNPELYRETYVASHPAGAIAEAFGDWAVWGPWLLEHPRHVKCLVHYEFAGTICDLDTADELVRLGIRPSHVVTKERPISRAWARNVYEEGRFDGVSWWSYRDPRWASVALWNITPLGVRVVIPLTAAQAQIDEARAVLRRPWGDVPV